MVPADHAEIVHPLVAAAVVEVGGSRTVAHAQETIDADHREARFGGGERTAIRAADLQALNAQRLDAKVGALARAKQRDVSFLPSESEFVQQSGAEGVDVLAGEAGVRGFCRCLCW
jgi:hypothetical protein